MGLFDLVGMNWNQRVFMGGLKGMVFVSLGWI